MISFGRLAEIVELQKHGSSLQGSGLETRAMHAIRTGLNTKSGKTFWDDFLSVCGNSEALAELLDVPKEKINRWTSLVRENLEKVHRADDEESKNNKDEMIPTGQLKTPDEDGGKKDIPETRPIA